MSLQYKNFSAHCIKALDESQGILEAIVSVFNVVDRADERVLPGFFTESLDAKLPKGVWMHDWSQPIAKTLEAKELLAGDAQLPESVRTYGGLYIKAQFNLDTQRGREAFSDLKFGTVDEFSFGYEVTEDKKAEKGVRDLVKGIIYEWSPVLVGCNPVTEVISAKSDPAKSDKKMNSKNQTGAVEVKAQYLGDYVESAMTMAAISRLNDALFYNVVYDCIWDENTPLDERLAVLRAACDEFRDILVRTVQTLLSSDETDDAKSARVEEFKAGVKAYFSDPDATKIAGSLRAGLTVEKTFEVARDANQKAIDRMGAIRDLRAKEGRALSQANCDRLSGLLESLRAASDELEQMLNDCSPAPDETGEKSAAGKSAAGKSAGEPLADAAAVQREMDRFNALISKHFNVG